MRVVETPAQSSWHLSVWPETAVPSPAGRSLRPGPGSFLHLGCLPPTSYSQVVLTTLVFAC